MPLPIKAVGELLVLASRVHRNQYARRFPKHRNAQNCSKRQRRFWGGRE